ncbi:POK9 protein, partial [Nyctibius grandis]|nr:POK9 protein [Nyctibius grandis]
TAVACTLIDQQPQRIETTVIGPVMINGKPCGALLLGRSSSGLKGLFILPGLIDADFTGTISIVVQTIFPPMHIPAGSKIAQLVPIPQLTRGMEPLSLRARETAGFGSTGDIAMLTM